MTFRKLLAALAALLMSLSILTACSNNSSSGGGGGAEGKRLKIGVSYPTANSPFWKAYTDFVQQGAKQLDVDVTLVSADLNEQKQLADVQNLISQRVDGLIITPQSTSIAPTLLRTAAQAKIPVVVTDRYPGYDPGTNDKADYVAFIGPDDVQAGKGIADELMKAGAKKFLAIGGVPGNSVSEGRKTGLEKAMADGGASLVQYQAATGESEEKGLESAENLLQANPAGKADAFWCYNDNLCMGAIKAAKNAGRSDQFLFGGMDLSPQGLDAIEAGTYTVSFGGHWLQGGFGLAILYAKIKNGTSPSQPVVKLDLLAVTKDNVAEFRKKYIDNPPNYDFKAMVTDPSPKYQITLGS